MFGIQKQWRLLREQVPLKKGMNTTTSQSCIAYHLLLPLPLFCWQQDGQYMKIWFLVSRVMQISLMK